MAHYLGMTPHLIGLSGRARHGKDTAAAALVEHRGFTRYAFADRMKAYLYALDPQVVLDLSDWPHVMKAAPKSPARDRLHGRRIARLSDLVDGLGWEIAKEIREVRRLLQALGTEAGRAILGEDVWVDATFREISRAQDAADDAAVDSARLRQVCLPAYYQLRSVIADVRFPNEAQAVLDAGGMLIRVVRPGYVTPAVLPHPSETALDDWPFEHVIEAETTVGLQSRILALVS
jgi:hypothetical protein